MNCDDRMTTEELRAHLQRDHRLDCPPTDTRVDLINEHKAAREYEALRGNTKPGP
jgi:hypothetical protein